jgi:uncharacterized membrane protein
LAAGVSLCAIAHFSFNFLRAVHEISRLEQCHLHSEHFSEFRKILEKKYVLGLGIFLFTTASRTAIGPTQPPIQWVLGALFLEVKRSAREADHSPPSSAEVKE